MELDERIAILENEIRVLKEEIQPTLNEIQEHVHARYNPAPPLTDEPESADETDLDSSADTDSRTRALSQWVIKGSKKMGSEHLVSLLQVSAQQGLVPPDMYQAFAGIVPLHPHAAPQMMSANDILGVVLDLDALLGRPQDPEEALSLLEEAKIG